MPSREEIIVTGQVELLLNVESPSMLFLVTHCHLEQAWNFKAIIGQFESLESSVELKSASSPTESSQAYWIFRKRDRHLCPQSIPCCPCRQLPCLLKAPLPGTRQWDTCFVLLQRLVKKWQHGGGETQKDSAWVFLHSGLFSGASASADIVFPVHTLSGSQQDLTKSSGLDGPRGRWSGAAYQRSTGPAQGRLKQAPLLAPWNGSDVVFSAFS